MNKPSLRVVSDQANLITEIHIYGVIGDYWWTDDPVSARKFLEKLNLADTPEIHVYINSPGGDVHEGLAICNAIKASKKIIKTYNDGICASMAAVILAAAPEGRRFAAKSSLTMLHSASTYAWGNAQDLRETADSLEKHDNVLAEIIADAMSSTVEDIQSTYFDGTDHWLTAKEIEALGMVEVLDYTIGEIPENPTDKQLHQIAAFYNPKKPKTQNTDMSLFSKQFKGVAALAKIAVADVTDEQLEAANNSLKEEGIEGYEIVKTTDVENTIQEAEKVPDLEKKIKDLEDDSVSDKKKIKDLEAKVAEFNNKPADEGNSPVTTKTDDVPGKNENEQNEFRTSVDDLAEQYL